MHMNAPAADGLCLRGMRVRRGTGQSLQFPEIGLCAGEQAVVCGPSGSGKTTLLAALAGLLPFQATEARLGEHDLLALGRASGAAWDRFRARHVGLVPQQPLLIGAIDLLENLMLAQRLAGVDPDPVRARESLAELGLGALCARRPAALSRGQQQRVALARALINQPRLILADEPTANLDDALAEQAIALLREQARRHGAVLLIATHDARAIRGFERRLSLASHPEAGALIPAAGPTVGSTAGSAAGLAGGAIRP